MKTLSGLLGFLVLLAVQDLPRANAADAPRELRVQLAAEPVSLDPAHADDDFAVRVVANVMDGLVGYDGTGKLQNLLASSYAVSRDGKTYTFTLRPGALWSDGKPVAADDFVVGVRRVLDPRTGAKLANMLYPIRGAREFNTGKGSPDAVGVRAQKGKLVIELEQPAYYFIHVLIMAQAAPARADVLEANGGKWPETGPVTGPYRIASHIPDQEIRLEPNPRCWRYKKSFLPVDLKVIPDESTAASLFESGKLDLVTRVSPSDLLRWKSKPELHNYPQAATYFLSFNARKAPFNDRKFRQAVAGSVSREEVVASIGATNRVADGWIPSDLIRRGKGQGMDAAWFAPAVKSIAAKLKLESVPVTAAFNTNAQNTVIMEKLQFDLKKLLGLDVQLNNMDWKTYMGLIRSDTPQIYRFQRGASFMDPIWHLTSFKGDDANNPTGWKNAEYDRLVDHITAMPLGAARNAEIQKAERILVRDEAIVVPLFFPMLSYLVSDRVQGLKSNPLSVIPFEQISLKP